MQLTDGGAIRIAARVVATLARDAAATVPGVRVAFGRHSHGRIADLVEKATLHHRHPHAAVGVLGRTAVIDLALAVRYGDQVDEVARQVQQHVITELRDHRRSARRHRQRHRRRRHPITTAATAIQQSRRSPDLAAVPTATTQLAHRQPTMQRPTPSTRLV